MIDSELLNRVMGYNDSTLRNIRQHPTQVGYIQFDDCSVNEQPYECEMNKYEFIAHCKQWAMNRGYQISACRPIVQDDRGAQVINYWVKSYIIKFDIGSFEPPYQILNFDCNEDSEFDAIIKACEWILKNDEPRLL